MISPLRTEAILSGVVQMGNYAFAYWLHLLFWWLSAFLIIICSTEFRVVNNENVAKRRWNFIPGK
jgi:hypothetical protein